MEAVAPVEGVVLCCGNGSLRLVLSGSRFLGRREGRGWFTTCHCLNLRYLGLFICDNRYGVIEEGFGKGGDDE